MDAHLEPSAAPGTLLEAGGEEGRGRGRGGWGGAGRGEAKLTSTMRACTHWALHQCLVPGAHALLGSCTTCPGSAFMRAWRQACGCAADAAAAGLSALLAAVRRLESWFSRLEENEVPKGYITLMTAGARARMHCAMHACMHACCSRSCGPAPGMVTSKAPAAVERKALAT